MGTETAPTIAAVVVTHDPDTAQLQALLEALAPQVAHVVVVDNASPRDVQAVLAALHRSNVELLRLPENLGLAFAQNAGIERALERGSSFVYLSDQDSLPTPSLLADLLAAWNAAQRDTGRAPVAAIGPATVDVRTGEVSLLWRGGRLLPWRWRPPRIPPAHEDVIEVEFLIASGTLIASEVLRRIGAMRSGYFIDHVDTEWCFRSKAAGYRLLAAPSARLQHRLGDSVSRIWFLRSRQVMHHSPLRDYYMFRNTLLLLADTALPAFWRVQLRGRLLQFAAYFLLLAPHRRERLALMWLGLRHGFAGVGGRLDPRTGRCHTIPRTALDPSP